MSDFVGFMTAIVSGLQTPVTIYGFTFSFWDISMWSLLAGLIVWFVVRLFSLNV